MHNYLCFLFLFRLLPVYVLTVLSLWCQAGTGAVWPLTRPKRSCRTPRREPSWCGTALREITCSPYPPRRQRVRPTCESSTNTVNSSWTRWFWWSRSWSSLTAWSTWWSTTSSCPGPATRRRRTLSLLRRLPTARCSCCSPNPCTRPRRRCSTSAASPSTGRRGRSRICRSPTDWRTTWPTTPTTCRRGAGRAQCIDHWPIPSCLASCEDPGNLNGPAIMRGRSQPQEEVRSRSVLDTSTYNPAVTLHYRQNCWSTDGFKTHQHREECKPPPRPHRTLWYPLTDTSHLTTVWHTHTHTHTHSGGGKTSLAEDFYSYICNHRSLSHRWNPGCLMSSAEETAFTLFISLVNHWV